MTWKEFCDKSYQYLLSILRESLKESDLDKYFLWDSIKLNSLKDIFWRLIKSAQNYQMLPNVINYELRKKEVDEILFWLDHEKVLEKYDVESLFNIFQKKFNFAIKDSKRNSWLKRTKSIISSAKFVNQFESIDDFSIVPLW